MLALIGYKACNISLLYKGLKARGIKYRKRLCIIDDVIIVSVETNREWFHSRVHNSGVTIIDWTQSDTENGLTQLERVIEKYNITMKD